MLVRCAIPGWEFGITYRKAWSDFNFTASANISTYKNEVTSLGNGDAIYGHAFDNVTVLTKTEVGQPVGYFYGYATNGIFQNEEQVEGSAQRESAKPGDIRFKDLDSDDVLDEQDRTKIGDPWPDFVMVHPWALLGKDLILTYSFKGHKEMMF